MKWKKTVRGSGGGRAQKEGAQSKPKSLNSALLSQRKLWLAYVRGVVNIRDNSMQEVMLFPEYQVTEYTLFHLIVSPHPALYQVLNAKLE